MTGDYGILAEDYHSLFQCMGHEELWLGINCTNEKSVFVKGKEQTLPLVKTTAYFGTKYVGILSGRQFFQSNFGESLFVITSILSDG